MSFKQTKHWDSEVMRSLEKVAYEKGLIKPEPLQKQASLSKTADITPTSDLMQNIIKLCIALRAEGLVKEAAEVETNFFNYKKAQTLYEVTKEKGEDLVDAAHPQGSHKLEGLDSEEAVVEDIVDRHNKMKAVVDKKPTGKYSSTKDILNAVKVTLGADPLAMERGNLSTKKGLSKQAADGIAGLVASVVVSALALYGGKALVSAALTTVRTAITAALAAGATPAAAAASAAAAVGMPGAAATASAAATAAVTSAGLGSVAAAAAGTAAATAISGGMSTVAAAAAGEAAAAAIVSGIGASGAAAAGSAAAAVIAGGGSAAAAASSGATAATTATSIAAGTLTGGAGASAAAFSGFFGTLAGAVTVGGAVLTGGLIGYVINSKLYDADFYSKDLKEASDKITNYAQHVNNNDIKMKAEQFKSVFSKVLLSASAAKLVDDPQSVSPEDFSVNLKAVGNYGSNLANASNIALEIDKIIDDESNWYSGFTSPLESNAKRNLSASLEGFINLSSTISEQISDLHHKLLQKSKELKASQSPGGTSELTQLYVSYAKQIDQWKAKANALQTVGKLPNADKVFIWLNQADKEVKVRQDKLKDTKDPAIVKIYLDDFNEKIKPKLDAFRDKGPLK
jgi:hypothetical protein